MATDYTQLKRRTLVEGKIQKGQDGYYRYVNHDDKITTIGFDNLNGLLNNKDAIRFDDTTVKNMKERYDSCMPIGDTSHLMYPTTILDCHETIGQLYGNIKNVERALKVEKEKNKRLESKNTGLFISNNSLTNEIEKLKSLTSPEVMSLLKQLSVEINLNIED